MVPEVQSSIPKQQSKRNIIITVLLIFIAIMLISTSVLSYILLHSTTVYKGVYVGRLDVSGMGRHDMLQYLETQYTVPATELKITLKSPSASISATYPELEVDYDINAAAEAAYSVGRTGNVFRRLFDIMRSGLRGTVINMPQSYNEEKIDSFVNAFCKEASSEVREGSLLITNDHVVIRSGSHGESVNKEDVKALVMNMIKNNKGGLAEPEVTVTYPTPFDADEIYSQITSEPVDASFTMEDGTLKVVPHVVGKKIDKSLLEKILEEHNKTENTDRELPVTMEEPAVTTQTAVSMLFRDELANVTTDFKTATTNEKNRAHNIGLAVSKFNGTILLPGEEFSFNDVVGSRSAANGYKEAHVFVNGRVEDGIGGGICQAVSTLYNAVLLSDLKVTERRNHSFIVTYVPLGQDATAYYGGTDLRFINNTQWPLKIEGWLDKNKVHVVFKGTNTTPQKSVLISNKILSRTPYDVKYVDDPTLPVGTTKKSQYGTDGYVVETYKTVKMGDEIVSQTKIHTSRYKQCTEEILVGIRNPDGTTTPGLAEAMRIKNTPAPAATPQPAASDTPDTPADPEVPETPDTADIPDSQSTAEQSPEQAPQQTPELPPEQEVPAESGSAAEEDPQMP
jgi:vancomycin resistance protein YoaR